MLEPIKRVRAILITQHDTIMMIKRVKPDPTVPAYWVAPGGGVEDYDQDLVESLRRELMEELGAHVEIVNTAFVLRHQVGEKDLEEHFFICHLLDYDLGLRNGPEFNDPARGQYIPDEIKIDTNALNRINIKTLQLREWLMHNTGQLKSLASQKGMPSCVLSLPQPIQ